MTAQHTTIVQRHSGVQDHETANTVGTHWKTATCVVLSLFYFAMLAYPFGVSGEGYALNKALIAAVIFFAISIPAWIINIKKEFLTPDTAAMATEDIAEETEEEVDLRISQLAVRRNWLSPEEVKQIRYCQEGSGKRFGEVAVKRNYLSLAQVNTLMEMQEA